MRNSKSKKNLVTIVALVLVIAVAGVLAACSGGNGDNSGGNPGVTNGASNTSPDDKPQVQQPSGGYYDGLIIGDEQRWRNGLEGEYYFDAELYLQYLSENFFDGKELALANPASQIPCRPISTSKWTSPGYGHVTVYRPIDSSLQIVDGASNAYSGGTSVWVSTEIGIISGDQYGEAADLAG